MPCPSRGPGPLAPQEEAQGTAAWERAGEAVPPDPATAASRRADTQSLQGEAAGGVSGWGNWTPEPTPV